MPRYEIRARQVRIEYFTEYYNASREALYDVTYVVDAEDETDARELYEAGLADPVDEEWYDIGEYLTSEFSETGDVFDEEYSSEEFESIEEMVVIEPQVRKPDWEV